MLTLNQLKVKEKGKILGYEAGEKAYKQKLLAMGLTPGVTIEIQRIAPLGDPIEILIRGFALTLRKNEAKMVKVERLA